MSGPLLTPVQARRVAHRCADQIARSVEDACETDLTSEQVDRLAEYVEDGLTDVLADARVPEGDDSDG